MLVKAGYRGSAMVSLIDKLRRQGQLELQLMGEQPDSIDRRSTTSTHPAPVERRIALQGVNDASAPGESHRMAYLDAINGMSSTIARKGSCVAIAFSSRAEAGLRGAPRLRLFNGH